jgi:hypothetical protein
MQHWFNDALFAFFSLGFQKSVIVEMQHWFNDALFAFFSLGFQKHVIVEMQHWFTDAIFAHIFVGYYFNEKAKIANGCEKTGSTFIQ